MIEIKCLRCNNLLFVDKTTSICIGCQLKDIEKRLRRLEQQ